MDKPLLWIFLIGFLIMLFPIRAGFHFWDEAVYLQHGEIFAGLRENTFNEFHTRPLFLSLVLGLGFRVFHSVVTAHIIVALMTALGGVFVYLFAAELLNNRKIGYFAAVIFLLNPLLLHLGHTVLVDGILPGIWAATMYFALRAAKGHDLVHFVFAGVFLGLSILTKFNSLALLPMTGAILLVYSKERVRMMYRAGLMYVVAFLVVLPYLIFIRHEFGSYFHSLSTSLQTLSWGIPTSTFFFYTHIFELFPFVFFLGILVLGVIVFKRREFRKEYLMLLILIAIPLLMSQRLLHKEMRYLTGLLPLFSILAATGFAYIRLRKWHTFFLIVVGAVVYMVPLSLPGFSLVTYESHPTMEAGVWLRENTEVGEVVYSNHQWPVVAYYSERNHVLLPIVASWEDRVEEVMPEPGYIVVPTGKAVNGEPRLDFLAEDNRFSLVRVFGEGEDLTYLYKYK